MLLMSSQMALVWIIPSNPAIAWMQSCVAAWCSEIHCGTLPWAFHIFR